MIAFLFSIVSALNLLINFSNLSSTINATISILAIVISFSIFEYVLSWTDYARQEYTITNKRIYGHKFVYNSSTNGKRIINNKIEFYFIRISYVDHVIIDVNRGDLVIQFDVDKQVKLLEVTNKIEALKIIENLALVKETF